MPVRLKLTVHKSTGGKPYQRRSVKKKMYERYLTDSESDIPSYIEEDDSDSTDPVTDSESDDWLMSNNRIRPRTITARKSCGKTPSNYQTIADLQRRQSLMGNGVQKQVTPLEGLPDDMPLIHFVPSNKNKMTINAAVGLNDPAGLEMLPVKVGQMRPSSSSQSGTVKKSKSKEKTLCKNFVNKLNDKNILLNELSQQIDLEDILKAYKENKTAEDINKEAVRVLGLESKKDTTNPEISNNMSAANMSCLQNILSELHKLYGSDNFMRISLQTIRDRLKPSDILEVFGVNEVKEALFQKCTPEELVNVLTNSDPPVLSEILKSASVNKIINLVKERNELRTSEPLLQEMLESFSQVIPEEPSPDCNDTVTNASVSQVALSSAFTNAVKSKKYLNSSEDLLNVMLRDGPNILSEESKLLIKNILKKKFGGPEFNDISHEVTKYHLVEKVIGVD